MFTVSIVPFGFATDIATLDALRFAQGAACGCIWAGGLSFGASLVIPASVVAKCSARSSER